MDKVECSNGLNLDNIEVSITSQHSGVESVSQIVAEGQMKKKT